MPITFELTDNDDESLNGIFALSPEAEEGYYKWLESNNLKPSEENFTQFMANLIIAAAQQSVHLTPRHAAKKRTRNKARRR